MIDDRYLDSIAIHPGMSSSEVAYAVHGPAVRSWSRIEWGKHARILHHLVRDGRLRLSPVRAYSATKGYYEYSVYYVVGKPARDEWDGRIEWS